MPWFNNTAYLKMIDSMVIIIAQAYQLARSRLASASSPVMRAMMQRDQLFSQIQWLKRELEILRQQRADCPANKRPEFSPEQRLAILQLMRQRNWSAAVAAKRFVIHPNTIRKWIRAIDGREKSKSLLPQISWNHMDDAVRWAVHELRQLCPEPEMGTLTIAMQMVRSGIQISRRSVQRILRETKPKKPRKTKKRWPKLNPDKSVEPYHLLTPSTPNQTWHMDIMIFRVLWTTYSAVAILDGATRKLLCLRAYRSKALDTQQMIQLVKTTTKKYDTPAHLITDHGVQFRNKFKQGLKSLGIKHVRGQVRTPSFNGKVERFFKTLRLWQRPALWPTTSRSIQQRLDQYQAWYNTARPHQALNGLTPEEAWHAVLPAEPIPIRSVDCPSCTPHIRVQRSRFGSDANLSVIKITLHRLAA